MFIQLNNVYMGIWVMNNALIECWARQRLPHYNSLILDVIKMRIFKSIFLGLRRLSYLFLRNEGTVFVKLFF